MREIKFRGKELETNKWAYGYYIKCRGHHYILEDYDKNGFDERWEEWIEVDPETIGQYTGVKDKNGKEIYEGDIVRGLNNTDYLVSFGEWSCEFGDTTPDDKHWGFFLDSIGYYWQEGLGSDSTNCLIGIGNIYENPELNRG